jgi:hypothetical protein
MAECPRQKELESFSPCRETLAPKQMCVETTTSVAEHAGGQADYADTPITLDASKQQADQDVSALGFSLAS